MPNLIILGVLNTFCTLNISFIPPKMAFHWLRWMDFERNKRYYTFLWITSYLVDWIFLCIRCAWSLARLTLVCIWIGWLWHSRIIFILWVCNNAFFSLIFSGILFNIWSEPYIFEENLYVALLCELHFTIYVQFRGIITSLMNGTVEN